MLNKSRDWQALYQAQAHWHLKSLTMSRISTASYNHQLCWFEKHDHQQPDESSLIEQSLLNSRSDESNRDLRLPARSSNSRSPASCYIWIIRINEYRLNLMQITGIWMSWEILSLNKILQPILTWNLWVELSSSALILILFDLILI